MHGKALLILWFSVVNASTTNEVNPRTSMLARRPARIVGGMNAEKNRYPWQISVHWGDPEAGIKQRHVCGGSLLTAGWVLTAGHCKTLAPKKGEFLLLAGKYRLDEYEEIEQSRIVTNTFVHPDYNGSVAPYDIALMKVERPFDLNAFVSTVTVPYFETIFRGQAMLTGWGSIGKSVAYKSPKVLQAATLPILDYDLCRKALDKRVWYGNRNPLHPTNICTGPLDGSKSACKGDSGGPLVTLNAFNEVEVIGIVSWGLFPCGRRNAPTVYTRVSAYLIWINTILVNN